MKPNTSLVSGTGCCLLAATLSLLLACSDEAGRQTAGTPGIRDLPDPAMQPVRLAPADPAGRPRQKDQPVRHKPVPKNPTGFTVDLDNRRVFMPTTGWLDAETFWDTYYRAPQHLSGDIDHQALEPLRVFDQHSNMFQQAQAGS